MKFEDLDERICVLVVYASGERIWEDARAYRRNPTPGSYVLQEKKRSGYRPPPIDLEEPAPESGISLRWPVRQP
jgi:hypothetical protein